jgi:unsaturated rhamnogalacturonyl hydrolase
MKKRVLYFFLFISFSFLSIQAATFRPDSIYSRWMCNSQALSKMGSWDYVPGLVAKSVGKTWEQYKDSTWSAGFWTAIKNYADAYTPSTSYSTLDNMNPGKMYHEVYRGAVLKNISDSVTYRTKATNVFNAFKNYGYVISSSLPGAGGYWHKSGYNTQMWLDGLYMGAALSAEWLGNFGYTLTEGERTAAWDNIALQFDTIVKYTWDADKKLFYHAWAANPDVNADTRYWADPVTGRSAEFWGRGMGWFFAAMVDVLEFMPAGAARTRMLNYVNLAADGLKDRQDATSGCWYQLLQYDATKQGTSCAQYNWLESSASSMFTYAYYKGVRIGVLDSATYIPVAEKAYQGLITNFISESSGNISIGQICSSAGLSSSRKGDANYYLCGSDAGKIISNEGKAIGPFIMASLEYEKIHLLGETYGGGEEPGGGGEEPGGGDPVFNDCEGMIHITLNNITQEDVYRVELWKTAKEKQIAKGTLKVGKTLLYFPKADLSGTYTYKVFNSQGLEQSALEGQITVE